MSAHDKIDAITTAAQQYANAVALESELEDGRALVKSAAVRRIMERDNIATTPAEKIVESDAEYASHRAAQRGATSARILAHAELTSATMRAQMSVAYLAHAEPTTTTARGEYASHFTTNGSAF